MRTYERRRFEHETVVFSGISATDEQEEPVGREADPLLQRHKRAGIVAAGKFLGYTVRNHHNLLGG